MAAEKRNFRLKSLLASLAAMGLTVLGIIFLLPDSRQVFLSEIPVESPLEPGGGGSQGLGGRYPSQIDLDPVYTGSQMITEWLGSDPARLHFRTAQLRKTTGSLLATDLHPDQGTGGDPGKGQEGGRSGELAGPQAGPGGFLMLASGQGGGGASGGSSGGSSGGPPSGPEPQGGGGSPGSNPPGSSPPGTNPPQGLVSGGPPQNPDPGTGLPGSNPSGGPPGSSGPNADPDCESPPVPDEPGDADKGPAEPVPEPAVWIMTLSGLWMLRRWLRRG